MGEGIEILLHSPTKEHWESFDVSSDLQTHARKLAIVVSRTIMVVIKTISDFKELATFAQVILILIK